MKKIKVHVLYILTVCLLISCNGEESSNKKSENTLIGEDKLSLDTTSYTKQDSLIVTDFCEAAGSGNLIIKPSDAKKMTGHFKAVYKIDEIGNPLDNLDTSYWVNSCIVLALDRFFTDSTGYDGIRIVFGSSSSESHKSKIFLVPTKLVKDPGGNPALNGHEDKWDIAIPNTGCAGSNLYFAKHQVARPYIIDFAGFYRRSPNPPAAAATRDSLSEKVWIDKCVIKSLANILNVYSGTYNLDGVNIKMAAYTKFGTSRPKGQFKPNQSSVILVLSKSGSIIPHEDVWEITELFYNLILKIRGTTAYNHGELCPNSCN